MCGSEPSALPVPASKGPSHPRDPPHFKIPLKWGFYALDAGFSCSCVCLRFQVSEVSVASLQGAKQICSGFRAWGSGVCVFVWVL